MTDVLIGCRTTPERGGRGRGLTCVDAATWEVRDVLECKNPSYICRGRDARTAYVVHGDDERVSRIRLSGDDRLTLAESQPSGGRNPVHLALSPSGAWLVVVNHSGTVAALPVADDGSLGAPAHVLTLEGEPGPHLREQGRSRPHQVVFVPGTDLLYVPDKGFDLVWVLRLSEPRGELGAVGRVPLRELTGPRHLALHPTLPRAYVIGELSSTVTVLDLTAPERPRPIQVHSSLHVDDVRDSRGAAIACSDDGRWVAATNRSGAGEKAPAGPGDDTVACFPVLPDGRLGAAQWVETAGQHPRFAGWEGGALYVANEWTDTVVRIDGTGSAPGAAAVVLRTGTPTCVAFL